MPAFNYWMRCFRRSNTVFPDNTNRFTTSTRTFGNKEFSFIPVNDAPVPFLIKGKLKITFKAMLQDTIAVNKVLIKAVPIQGSILLISATQDKLHIQLSCPIK